MPTSPDKLAEVMYDFSLCLPKNFAPHNSRELFEFLLSQAKKFEELHTDSDNYLTTVEDFFDTEVASQLYLYGVLEEPTCA
jgi:hypothetical protein